MAKNKLNGICRPACFTQDHETFYECELTSAFDCGWTNALMQLDMWIRDSMKTHGTQLQAVRAELIAMANSQHVGHLPETQEAIHYLTKTRMK